MTEQTFINKLAPIVVSSAMKSKILPSLTIAQACLETGYGKHLIGGFALFGIKGNASGSSEMAVTKEYIDGKWITITDSFRTYASWSESVADHAKFLNNVKLRDGSLRYKAVIGETDYKKACKAIFAAGYATGKNYDTILMKIIEQNALIKFDGLAVPPIDDAPQPTEKIVLYTVKKGDSWWGIAQKKLGRGGRYVELAQYNGKQPTSMIMPGQIIKLPM